MDWKSRLNRQTRLSLFKRNLKYATGITVQTQTAKKRFKALYPYSGPIWVIPNAISLPQPSSGEDTLNLDNMGKGYIKLLCLTRYYIHKNLEVLVPLAKLIKEKHMPIIIFLTISPEQNPKAKKLLQAIKKYDVDDVLHNLGPVPMKAVPYLYKSCDALLLPTLMESFSGTYVEARHFNVPVFTSNRGFSKEICGDNAFYFDPYSPKDILKTLEGAFRGPGSMSKKTIKGNNSLVQYPDWNQVSQSYLQMLHELAGM
jgi:glycosyltransferase involved in cell wall biosynthesis